MKRFGLLLLFAGAVLAGCATMPKPTNETAVLLTVSPTQSPSPSPKPNLMADVELVINGVGFATPEAKVIELLGQPVYHTKRVLDECAGGYHRNLVYEGLTIDILSDEKGKNYSVTQLELTSPKWEIVPGLHIGDPFSRVREIFGEPIYPAEEDGCLFYGIKGADGLVSFCQADGKLVRVHLNQTLC